MCTFPHYFGTSMWVGLGAAIVAERLVGVVRARELSDGGLRPRGRTVDGGGDLCERRAGGLMMMGRMGAGQGSVRITCCQ